MRSNLVQENSAEFHNGCLLAGSYSSVTRCTRLRKVLLAVCYHGLSHSQARPRPSPHVHKNICTLDTLIIQAYTFAFMYRLIHKHTQELEPRTLSPFFWLHAGRCGIEPDVFELIQGFVIDTLTKHSVEQVLDLIGHCRPKCPTILLHVEWLSQDTPALKTS